MEDHPFIQRDRFARHAGIRLTEAADGRAVARMDVSEIHLNGLNVTHGAAIFTLADLALAAAANSSEGVTAMAIHADISFLKAVTKGSLRAEAREVKSTRKIAVYEVRITDDAGDLAATMQGMVYRREK